MPTLSREGVTFSIPDDEWAHMDDAQRIARAEQEFALRSRSEIGDTPAALIRGAVKGTAGAVEQAGRGLFDLAQLAGAAAQQLGGEGVDVPRLDRAVEGLDLASRRNVVGEAIDQALPAAHPDSLLVRGTETFGSMAGPGGITAVTARGLERALPELVSRSQVLRGGEMAAQAPVKATAGTAGTAAAATGGGELAVELAGDESARPLGELAAGIAAPTIAQRAFDRLIPHVLPAHDRYKAGQVFDAQLELGMRPTPGSVGSPNAAYLETAATALPPFGGVVTRRAVNQVRRASDESARLTSDIRPPGARPANTPSDIGGNLREAAREGLDEIDDNLRALEDRLEQLAGGPQTPVRPTQTRATAARKGEEIATSDPKRSLGRFSEDLEADATPIHQPAQNLRETDLRAVEQQIERLPPDGTRATHEQLARLRARRDEILSRMRDNEGVPLGKFRDQRSQLGPRTQVPGGLSREVNKELYRAMSDDLRATYARAGGPPLAQQFNQLMALEQRLYAKKGSLRDGRDIEQLQKVINMADDASIYRWIAEGQTLPAEKFTLMRRNMTPDRWHQFTADFVERLGLARVGGQNFEGDVFSPQVFMTNWNRIGDPRLKAMLFPDPEWRSRIDRLAIAMEGLATRQTKGNPSGTAMVAVPIAAGERAVSAFTQPAQSNRGLAGLGQGAQKLAGQLLGQAMFAAGMLSERVARAIAGRDPTFLERLQRVAPQAAGLTAADPHPREADTR